MPKTWQGRLPDRVAETLRREVRRVVLDAYEQGRSEAAREIVRAYRDGRAAGLRESAATARGLDPAFLRQLVSLCHPDFHPGRVEKATRATQQLLALLDRQQRADARRTRQTWQRNASANRGSRARSGRRFPRRYA